MKCPQIHELTAPPEGKTGWPWTEGDVRSSAGSGHGAGIGEQSQWPRISIVMPCLNAGKYIEEALRSVLLQGYSDLELMVFDGGSTDVTVEIIRKYEPWLAYWVSEKDRGQSHAINKGLERATGELFNWFNADDVLCPGALMKLASLHVNEPLSIGVCGAFVQFDEAGKEELFLPVPGNKEQMGHWLDPFFLPQPSSLYLTRLCRDAGGVNEHMHYAMDVELVLKLLDAGAMAVTDDVIIRFRSHPESKTFNAYYTGLLEVIVANFNLGQPHVAGEVLRKRMEGHGRLAVGKLTQADVAKLVDEWSYMKLAQYVSRRLWKNIRIRIPGVP